MAMCTAVHPGHPWWTGWIEQGKLSRRRKLACENKKNETNREASEATHCQLDAMDSARPVLLTKTSEAAGEGRTSSTERAVTVMRKDDTVLLPTIETGHDAAGARRAVKEPSLAPQIMSRPCPLLNENLQMSDAAISWLGEGTEYLVIGVVGRQGVGKSTVMSMLAGQVPFCPIKKYMFPPETVQQVLNSEHRTNGVEMLVTGQRVVLLDTQPLLSPSIVYLLAQGDRKLPGDGGSLETQMELLALQQLAFLYTICHVVLVVQDWCVDSDLIRLLLTAEMLKPAASTASSDEPPAEHYPRLVFVHNRSTLSHFQPDNIRQLQELYRSAFSQSGLSVSSEAGGGCHQAVASRQAAPPASLLLLPEFTAAEDGVLTEEEAAGSGPPLTGHWGLASLVHQLRTELFRLPQLPLSHQPLSEKHWYHYAVRMWDNVRKSSFFHEYSRL